MADVRPFIRNHLLAPLQEYPTIIQETMLEIIAQRLQELYDYTIKFPEIISPDSSRLDILQAIADQFLFTIRKDADIREQIDILENILYLYKKRGSIDTIENMWKYYGGELPKNVKVVIPAYTLFRYNTSSFSGNHVFQDNNFNRSGIYEIQLINNTYPIEDLKKFLMNELVAAGNRIHFTTPIQIDILSDNTDPYRYNITEYLHREIDYDPIKYSDNSILKITNRDIRLASEYKYDLVGDTITVISTTWTKDAEYTIDPTVHRLSDIYLDSTMTIQPSSIVRDLYDSDGHKINHGYFIIGQTLLGKDVV